MENRKKNTKQKAIINICFVIAIIILVVPFVLDIFSPGNDGGNDTRAKQDASKITIIDGAHRLNASDIARIKSAMLPVTAYYPVAFVTGYSSGKGVVNFAKMQYGQIFNNKAGIIFIIDMTEHQLYLYTSDSNKLLSTSKCKSITDNVYRYATKGEYGECAVNAFDQVYSVMSGKRIPQIMKHMCNLLLAVCIALLTVFIIARRLTRSKSPEVVYQLDKDSHKNIVIRNTMTGLPYHFSFFNDMGDSHGKIDIDIGGILGLVFGLILVVITGGKYDGGGGGGHGGGHGF